LYSVARAGYYHYFRNLGRAFGMSRRRLAAMEQPLRHIIGVHGARMYYNLTNIHAVLRSAPFGEALAGYFNRFVGTEERSARDDARREGRAYDRLRDDARPEGRAYGRLRGPARPEGRAYRHLRGPARPEGQAYRHLRGHARPEGRAYDRLR